MHIYEVKYFIYLKDFMLYSAILNYRKSDANNDQKTT